MLINNILCIILSFFTTPTNYTDKILIKEPLIVESLSLSKDELIDLIVHTYNIPTNYGHIDIYTNYLNSPNFNKIYSVELIVDYDNKIINYNLKLKTIKNEMENKKSIPSPIVLSLLIGLIFILIIYIKRSN